MANSDNDVASSIIYVNTDDLLPDDVMDPTSSGGEDRTYVIVPSVESAITTDRGNNLPVDVGVTNETQAAEEKWMILDDEASLQSKSPTVVEILVEVDPGFETELEGKDLPEKPIEITEKSVVTVNGMSCVLRSNPENGIVYAYPARRAQKPGTRVRNITNSGTITETLEARSPTSTGSPTLYLSPIASPSQPPPPESPPAARRPGRPPKIKPLETGIARQISVKKTENPESWKCRQCGHQSYYDRQHQDHLRSQHGDQVLQCKCCNYVCLDASTWVQHYTTSHPKNFCTVCGLASAKAYVIKRHMMRHTRAGCTCEHCGKTFKDIYILKTHIKMIHMPAETLYECCICLKKFSRRAHLNRHLRIHEGERNYKCPYCNYCGIEKADLTKHKLIHGDPQYPCEICQKMFRQPKNRDLHMKRHNLQRDYKCGLCDFLGYTFTDIRKHIERAHKEKNSHYCEKCETVFKSLKECIDHVTSGQCDHMQAETSDDVRSVVVVPGDVNDVESSWRGVVSSENNNDTSISCTNEQLYIEDQSQLTDVHWTPNLDQDAGVHDQEVVEHYPALIVGTPSTNAAGNLNDSDSEVAMIVRQEDEDCERDDDES